MRVLIDADSIVYILGWHYREHGLEAESEVKAACTQFLKDIISITNATDYIGVFSPSETFRHRIYKYAPYKGTRPEKPEWMKVWESTIKEYFVDKHGFITVEDLEADDVVAAISIIMQRDGLPCVIASPDKDLRQVPGLHYNYKPNKDNDPLPDLIESVNLPTSWFNLWKQVAMGDEGDNVKGIPGLGTKKADLLFADALDDMQYPSIVLSAYAKYFGSYYGKIIFNETVDTIGLMGPAHSRWLEYNDTLAIVLEHGVRTLSTGIGFFDV